MSSASQTVNPTSSNLTPNGPAFGSKGGLRLMDEKARSFPLPEEFESNTRWMFLDEHGVTRGPFAARKILELIDEGTIGLTTVLTEVESQRAARVAGIKPFSAYFRWKGQVSDEMIDAAEEDARKSDFRRTKRKEKLALVLASIFVVAAALALAYMLGMFDSFLEDPTPPKASVETPAVVQEAPPVTDAEDPATTAAVKDDAETQAPTKTAEGATAETAATETPQQDAEKPAAQAQEETPTTEEPPKLKGKDPIPPAADPTLKVEVAEGKARRFDVYADMNSPNNAFYPTGFMGDADDLTVDLQNMERPYSGGTSVRISYVPKTVEGTNWAGLYWQNPPENWGETNGGYDLSRFNKIVFWARGETGVEIISEVKVGGIGEGEAVAFPDSGSKQAGPITLTTEWQEYSINLSGMDTTYVSGGFCVVLKKDDNPNGAVVHLDEIYFLYDPAAEPSARQKDFPFYVFKDDLYPQNRYYPTGTMGDGDGILMDTNHRDNCYEGSTCVKFTFTPSNPAAEPWAGLYWQNPENNWGNIDGGYNLTDAVRLTFWVRGDIGDERIEEFKVGGIEGKFSDSDVAGIGPIRLTTEWKQYSIPLKGRDLSYISGGFCWAASVEQNLEGLTFYLDDIRYEVD